VPLIDDRDDLDDRREHREHQPSRRPQTTTLARVGDPSIAR
jgi:hypothetical protein